MDESRQSVVLIGTLATVRLLSAQLALLERPPRVAGVLLERAGSLEHVPVLGTIDQLAEAHAALGFSEALVCLPSSEAKLADSVLALLRELGVKGRLIRPLEEQIARTNQISTPAVSVPLGGRIDFAELIGRRPYPIDRDAVGRMLTGKRVLITGAGGSIGSEIARIVAGFDPAQIVLIDRSENALFEIDRQLSERFASVPRRTVLHDVCNGKQTVGLLAEVEPDVVFHAAAHKHVPLMEDHPSHALSNNLFGTKSIAEASVAVGVERFVLISSDKAVNPTSVMGATKRLAELYLRGIAPTCDTRFSIVRFGNVLGSACSVLPIWSAQLATGSPITVTDERMTRYFMTINEAAALVIQSAAIEPDEPRSAPVFVLDMGEPVKILELAQRFVQAHGLTPRLVREAQADPTPDGCVDIVLIGARPGEKLHEELAYAAELLAPTGVGGINMWSPGRAGDEEVADPVRMIRELLPVRSSPDRESVLESIRAFVPQLRRREAESGRAVEIDPRTPAKTGGSLAA